jgi:hypothetical protein
VIYVVISNWNWTGISSTEFILMEEEAYSVDDLDGCVLR